MRRRRRGRNCPTTGLGVRARRALEAPLRVSPGVRPLSAAQPFSATAGRPVGQTLFQTPFSPASRAASRRSRGRRSSSPGTSTELRIWLARTSFGATGSFLHSAQLNFHSQFLDFSSSSSLVTSTKSSTSRSFPSVPPAFPPPPDGFAASFVAASSYPVAQLSMQCQSALPLGSFSRSDFASAAASPASLMAAAMAASEMDLGSVAEEAEARSSAQ
ncbi:hypothetical protein BRADI_1g58976v3 [Brachypodium distachyon]|uniref:Uncharacterized protein n=1 Tax=Brachypodium distachyon TaxID=15368 RepID=A0A2K2DSE7_BRADI|nr:hypothetical protein BRADI_1g58976v3 [Brachypodium distachyon]